MSNVLILILSVILLFSILINVFFLWYLSNLTKKLMFFSENLNDLLDIIENFTSHIKSVYELETFYGDQTLENLLSHAKALTEEFDKYQSLFEITQEGQDDGEADQETPQAQG